MKANSKVTFSEAGGAEEIVDLFKSDTSVLGYAWNSVSERAAVVRSDKDLDYSRARYIDCDFIAIPLSKRDLTSPSIEKTCDIYHIALLQSFLPQLA